MEIIDCMGFKVFNGRLNEVEFGNENVILNTISPISYGISVKDKSFREALKASDILVLDGMLFGLSSVILKKKVITLNQGPEVFYYFMSRLNKIGGKAFFLGASPSTLNKMKLRAAKEYPNVKVDTFSPPFKAEFSETDSKEMIDHVNSFRADVLFIGMTCPKQEKWSYFHKNELKAKLTVCIGAVFDWYAGIKPISPIWWKLRLGWLKRLIDRPEMIKRYPHIVKYIWHLNLAVLGFRKYRTGNF